MFDYKSAFKAKLSTIYSNGLEWEIVGIILKSEKVYTLSYDSKILSGIFEILMEPIIREIASENDFIVEKTVQNSYPDFTLYHSYAPNKKIAIEVKSTYRKFNKKGILQPFSFTLGSYRSYLRDPAGTKSILYPYSEYSEHWIIGFLYSRNEECDKIEIKGITQASNLQSPFIDIDYFIQQKHLIAGRRPGSGNTTNIGSIKSSNIEDFKNGNGPFKSKKEFEDFWRNY